MPRAWQENIEFGCCLLVFTLLGSCCAIWITASETYVHRLQRCINKHNVHFLCQATIAKLIFRDMVNGDTPVRHDVVLISWSISFGIAYTYFILTGVLLLADMEATIILLSKQVYFVYHKQKIPQIRQPTANVFAGNLPKWLGKLYNSNTALANCRLVSKHLRLVRLSQNVSQPLPVHQLRQICRNRPRLL